MGNEHEAFKRAFVKLVNEKRRKEHAKTGTSRNVDNLRNHRMHLVTGGMGFTLPTGSGDKKKTKIAKPRELPAPPVYRPGRGERKP